MTVGKSCMSFLKILVYLNNSLIDKSELPVKNFKFSVNSSKRSVSLNNLWAAPSNMRIESLAFSKFLEVFPQLKIAASDRLIPDLTNFPKRSTLKSKYLVKKESESVL